MQYDFTSIMDRRGKDALAVDALVEGNQLGFGPTPPKNGFDPIPMWVADMNFPTLPAIQEAMILRTQHPAFGYFTPSKQYYDAIIGWQKRRNDVDDLLPEYIGYENGVLGCVSSALQAFTAPGEAFLMHSPTYIGFTHVAHDTGRVP